MHQKIVSWEKAQALTQQWKQQGDKVVFTNGCFDLLHPGHVTLLDQAKKAGDRLVVGLGADCSVTRSKGPTRPIQSETARALILAALSSVDLVILFTQDGPLELIQTLKPHILVKGADYTFDRIWGAPFVQSYGGQILLVDLVEGHSTTTLVSKIAKGKP
jgi:D-beta-D-heptose 7-phosphate kinase/D-beta-D-heptose 1-phosphate adenosyltransferase